MRAEEGDESIRDYAIEGEQTHKKMKDAQQEGQGPLHGIRQRLVRLLGGDRAR